MFLYLPTYTYIMLSLRVAIKNPLINQSLLQAHTSYVSSENYSNTAKRTQIWHFSCLTFNQRYHLQRKNWNHKSLAGVRRPPTPLNDAPDQTYPHHNLAESDYASKEKKFMYWYA